MSVVIVHGILAAAAPVTALVGERISPLERKDFEYPAIVLESQLSPINTLTTTDRDKCTVTVSYWDTTYAGAHGVADVGRAALQDAGILVTGEQDSFDQLSSLGGLVCVTQTVEFVS